MAEPTASGVPSPDRRAHPVSRGRGIRVHRGDHQVIRGVRGRRQVAGRAVVHVDHGPVDAVALQQRPRPPVGLAPVRVEADEAAAAPEIRGRRGSHVWLTQRDTRGRRRA